ncbi:MAG TPA: MBL fold metallo-hydrolase [Rhodopila sp.]|nr:MBL fold metallo-hydrolase [Rhodopila sp.]
MTQQVPVDDHAEAGIEIPEESVFEIAPDVAYRRLALVNIVLVGQPQGTGADWVLIDAGLPGTAGIIARTAAARFAGGTPPVAIVMTHGHFDHVGALRTLAERWDVPIYAHPQEMPYLDGRSAYPPPDPGVGGGIFSRMSMLFPRAPVDVSRWLRPLPDDGSVPPLPGFRWIHTPGHAAGHVSFFRDADRLLIAGDAFVTTAQESAYAVTVQAPELHGPPMYFTHDWQAAAASVRSLAALEPEIVVCGHGRAMRGETMRHSLHRLANEFEAVAVPQGGRYVAHPARPQDGSAYPGV